MAVVLVLVGQCGNQLGDELLTQLTRITQATTTTTTTTTTAAAAAADASYSPLFSRRDGKARCILVDTEPKVVRGVFARHARVLRRDNVVCGQSGRGNNWALGYYYGVDDAPHASTTMTTTATRRCDGRYAATRSSSNNNSNSDQHDRTHAFRNLGRDQRAVDAAVLRDALRAIHHETRRTDDDAGGFDAIVLLHSLAGGTGSGLGARLAEKLRYYFTRRRCTYRNSDDDGNNVVDSDSDDDDDGEMRRRDGLDGLVAAARRARHLVSVAVAPVVAGELTTQSINATLTLDVLLRTVDAVVLLRNDDTIGNHSNNSNSNSVSRRRTASVADTLPASLPSCMTYKEANEVFVGLLLPLLHYGLGTPSSSSSSSLLQTRTHGAGDGVVGALVRQCVPCVCNHSSTTVRGSSMCCCCNRILTLVPLPQRSYARYQRAVQRARTYVLHNTRPRMPGCVPATLPLDVVLCARAKLQQQQQQRTTATSRRDGGSSRSTRRHDGDDDAAEAAVSVDVALRVPTALLSYYAAMSPSHHTPVSRLYSALDAVAVLSQVDELSATLLLPLLRSAALKAHVGAFVSSYAACGVTADDITAACKRVARALVDAAALTQSDDERA